LIIGLHSDESEIRRITKNRPDEASKCSTVGFLEKGEGFYIKKWLL